MMAELDEDPDLQAAIQMSLESYRGSNLPAHVRAAQCFRDASITEEVKALMLHIISHIASEPDNDKFRLLSMKKSKVALIWSCPTSKLLLRELGFVETGDILSLHMDEQCNDRVCVTLRALQTEPETKHSAVASTAASAFQTVQSSQRAVSERPTACHICGKNVMSHSWPPRGMLMRARAPWEGIQCDTCWFEKKPWFVICGECFNEEAHSRFPPHGAHLFSCVGYGPGDGEEPRRSRPPPPPPPGRPGSRPGAGR